jgi:uncharacterized protein (DUF2236 family)
LSLSNDPVHTIPNYSINAIFPRLATACFRTANAVRLPRDAIVLPSLLQSRLEEAAKAMLHAESGQGIDFSQPAGEPALVGPDSVSWEVFKNPVSLFIGGVAAVILELAEPHVRTGIWEHTTFRTQPLPRLQRTGMAAMMTVFGPRSQASAMIARVRTMHDRINGFTESGEPYSASDPRLLGWVHATAGFGFLEAHNAYARPLSDAERDRYYADGAISSRLYGAVGAPTSQQEIDALFDAMRERLEPSPIVFEFLDIIQTVPFIPRPFGVMQPWLIKAAIAIVPAWVRERLGLNKRWDMLGWQRGVVRKAGAMADRIVLRSGPAVQSCRRLGLPDEYLYARHPR